MSQSAAQLSMRMTSSPAASPGYAPAASAGGAVASRWPSSSLSAGGAAATPAGRSCRLASHLGTAEGGRTRTSQQPAPRETREWVAKQAAIDAEFALNQRLHAATYRGVPKVPYREAGSASVVGNFIAARPVPQPARKTFTETHGVPWLRADATRHEG